MTGATKKKGKTSVNQGIALTDLPKIHRQRKALYNKWLLGDVTNDALRAGMAALKELSAEHRIIAGDNPLDHQINISWGKR